MVDEDPRACGRECSRFKCKPCAYIGLLLVVPYSLYLLYSGYLLGIAFLAYGLLVSHPLLIHIGRIVRGRVLTAEGEGTAEYN